MAGLLDKKIIITAISMAAVSVFFLFTNSDTFAVVATYFMLLTAYLLQRYSHQPERSKTAFITILALIAAVAWALSRWEGSSLFGLVSSAIFFMIVIAIRLFTRIPLSQRKLLK